MILPTCEYDKLLEKREQDKKTRLEILCIILCTLSCTLLLVVYAGLMVLLITNLHYNCSPFECQYEIINKSCRVTGNDLECSVDIRQCSGLNSKTSNCIIERTTNGTCYVSTKQCTSNLVIGLLALLQYDFAFFLCLAVPATRALYEFLV